MTPALERMRGNAYNTFLIARLAPHATLPAARRAVAELAASLPRLHPEHYPRDWKTVADAFPLRDRAVRDARRPLLVLLGAVGVVLLIACINVSGLLLARASARHHEIATRQALGASTRRLVQQFLAEGLVLAAAGGTLGVLVAAWGARVLARHAPARLLDGFAPAVDLRVLGVTAVVAIVTAVAFSLVPAVGHRQRGALAPALREAARGGTAGAQRQRGRRLLVVAEVAFALVLAALAGLMVRSFVRATHTDPGFDPAHVVTFRAGLPEARYPTAAGVLRLEQRLADELARLPGVRAASATSNLPLGGPSRVAFAPEGVATPNVPLASGEIVYPGYLEALGVRLRDGRAFTAGDVAGALPVAVVNETLARRYFGASGAAIGRRVKWGSPQSPNPWLTIVGVTADVKVDGLDQPVLPAIYFPAWQQDSAAVRRMLRGVSFVVRASGDDAATLAAARRVAREVDPELPIVGLRTMADVLGVSVSERRFNTALLAGFAGLALLLASVGIYGVVAYAVSQRTREIGVRMAVGATRGDVLRLVVGQGARLAAAGVAFGLVGAVLAARLAAAMLYEVSPVDPLTFGASALLLLAVAALASAWPAVLAARIDPQQAIRAE
jgi:predicted permease